MFSRYPTSNWAAGPRGGKGLKVELTRGWSQLTGALEILVCEVVHVAKVIAAVALGGRGVRRVWCGVSRWRSVRTSRGNRSGLVYILVW